MFAWNLVDDGEMPDIFCPVNDDVVTGVPDGVTDALNVADKFGVSVFTGVNEGKGLIGGIVPVGMVEDKNAGPVVSV